MLAYPQSARKRGISGTVVVELTVRPTGEIERVVLVESSRHGVLDTAALEAVRSVRPRPFPPDLPRSALRFEHTIVFELR